MTTFIHHVRKDTRIPKTLTWGTFVDDRIVWDTGENCVQTVLWAMQHAWHFDTRCGWQWNKKKGVLFASKEEHRAELREQKLVEVGDVVTEFVNLGVNYIVDGSTTTMTSVRSARTSRQRWQDSLAGFTKPVVGQRKGGRSLSLS